MKKLILFELALLFLATTFSSSPPPPGWYQQTLPVNDFVNDIFFLDSLNGWIVTEGEFNSNDTAYILHTSDGGKNWNFQYSGRENILCIQFLDINTGYACGGTNGTTLMTVLKTTNSGLNWQILNNITGIRIQDIDFLNKDTGWVSASDFMFGGIWKTTDGGNNWIKQFSPPPAPPNDPIHIKSIFILNEDTGWAISSDIQSNLYRTENGGMNWNIQYTFNASVQDVYFLNRLVGFVSKSTMAKTTDGGFNWIDSDGSNGGIDIHFISDSIGWAGQELNRVAKTTNGGRSWFYQSSPVFSNVSISIIDTLKGWAAGTGIVKTTNGGISTSIGNSTSEVPSGFILYQNYPNPFNPKTIISYDLNFVSYVKLIVYDIKGKKISNLTDQKESPGEYEVEFDGSAFSSGIYFYQLEISDEKSNQIFSETKKMILTK